MRAFIVSALVLGASAILPGQAAASSDVADRTAAIQLCRAEIAAQADGADVRLDHVRVRPRQVRVHLDVWRGGQLTNVRCDVARGGAELTVAAISPPFATAIAQR